MAWAVLAGRAGAPVIPWAVLAVGRAHLSWPGPCWRSGGRTPHALDVSPLRPLWPGQSCLGTCTRPRPCGGAVCSGRGGGCAPHGHQHQTTPPQHFLKALSPPWRRPTLTTSTPSTGRPAKSGLPRQPNAWPTVKLLVNPVADRHSGCRRCLRSGRRPWTACAGPALAHTRQPGCSAGCCTGCDATQDGSRAGGMQCMMHPPPLLLPACSAGHRISIDLYDLLYPRALPPSHHRQPSNPLPDLPVSTAPHHVDPPCSLRRSTKNS